MTTTIELTEAEEARRGELLAHTLKLRRDREYPETLANHMGDKNQSWLVPHY